MGGCPSVPEASPLTPLSLHSKVLLSDGRDLVVRVTARDAMSQDGSIKRLLTGNLPRETLHLKSARFFTPEQPVTPELGAVFSSE